MIYLWYQAVVPTVDSTSSVVALVHACTLQVQGKQKSSPLGLKIGWSGAVTVMGPRLTSAQAARDFKSSAANSSSPTKFQGRKLLRGPIQAHKRIEY